MGEVRVRVKLTNPMDEATVRRGYESSEKIRSAEAEAVVDTGSVHCVLPESMADRLGLARPFTKRARYADGRKEAVSVTEPVLMEILGRKTYQMCLILGSEFLIGQLALESTDLFVDCGSQRLVPNPENPDEAVTKVY